MWTRSQEVEGDCRFDGRGLMTRAVADSLSPFDVVEITRQLRASVKTHDGLDYLQIFTSEDGRKVWAIDDGEHWTLLFPSDY